MNNVVVSTSPLSLPVNLLAIVANFAIGTVAGLASVFLPRMMLLLSVDIEPAPDRYISVLSGDFILLGLSFAAVVGVICAILEFGADQDPRAVFMTALGVPALISGVLNTTSATGKLQKVEQEKVAALQRVGAESGIGQERVRTWQPVAMPGPGGPSSESDRPAFALVSPAYAEGASGSSE
jgi:hypothetical protein